jgi:hypothetical protein
MLKGLSLGQLPQFVLGETFLSWAMRALAHNKLQKPHLYRQALSQAFSPRHISPDAIPSWPFPDFRDIEFEYDSELFKITSTTYGIDEILLRRLFAPRQSGLIHIHFRHSYCYFCLVESMADTGFPIWRQSWCYTTSAYCMSHRCALQKSRDMPTPERRIWDAYLHSKDDRPVVGSLFDRRLAGVTIRIQQWAESLASGQDLTDGLEMLYGLLLARRTAYAPGGIAATGFARGKQSLLKTNLDLCERVQFGLSDCDPYQRTGALLLMGWLADKVSADEIAYLSHYDHCVRRTLQASPEHLGYMVGLGLTAEDVLSLREKLAGLEGMSSSKMPMFLNALFKAKPHHRR